MNDPRIIYKTDDGGVAIIIPYLGSGISVEQIALKDVPAGKPFRIVEATEIPSDRSFRDAWTVDETDLIHGIGADYGVGSNNNVVAWTDDNLPIIQGDT